MFSATARRRDARPRGRHRTERIGMVIVCAMLWGCGNATSTGGGAAPATTIKGAGRPAPAHYHQHRSKNYSLEQPDFGNDRDSTRRHRSDRHP